MDDYSGRKQRASQEILNSLPDVALETLNEKDGRYNGPVLAHEIYQKITNKYLEIMGVGVGSGTLGREHTKIMFGKDSKISEDVFVSLIVKGNQIDSRELERIVDTMAANVCSVINRQR